MTGINHYKSRQHVNTRPVYVCEIRPLDGGAEAEAFAGELLDSLAAYARNNRLDHHVEEAGRGLRSLYVYSQDLLLPSLAGVHRVQRQPAGGRGKHHTSTVSLAVIGPGDTPVATLDERELEVSWFRGSGPGGQHRNTTEQAVRLRHLPSGVTVTVDGRSRSQNLERARTILADRLAEQATAHRRQHLDEVRRHQTGLPSALQKDFTWNWQRSEVVCHRTGRVWRLKDALRGRWA